MHSCNNLVSQRCTLKTFSITRALQVVTILAHCLSIQTAPGESSAGGSQPGPKLDRGWWSTGTVARLTAAQGGRASNSQTHRHCYADSTGDIPKDH